MATSTYKTFLMYKKNSSSEYTQLVDIKEFPDLGGDPELLDATTLSQKVKTYVMGIQDTGSMSFTANYDHDELTLLKSLENETYDYAVWFGGDESDDGSTVTPTGDLGKFSFKGQLSAYASGHGVNEVRETKITLAPSTVIAFE